MKKSSLISAVVFPLMLCLSFRPANAQEKSKEEKEKELQDLIIEQKKAMVDQKKAQAEMKKVLEENRVELEKEMGKTSGNRYDPGIRRSIRIYDGSGRDRLLTGEPFVLPSPDPSFYFHNSFGDSERTTWDFSKSVKESSFSKDYDFDVEPNAKSVVMSVSGDCKEGEIRIEIKMPNGKTFSEIVIDEFGNMNWRKSITISDTENKDKTGTWKFEIKSSKASGYFRIFCQTS